MLGFEYTDKYWREHTTNKIIIDIIYWKAYVYRQLAFTPRPIPHSNSTWTV